MHIFQRESAKVFPGRVVKAWKEKWPILSSQMTRFSPGVPSSQLRQSKASCSIMPADMDVVSKPSAAAIQICRKRITAVHRQDNPPACVLANRTRILLSRFLVGHLAVGDEITFPVPAGNGNIAAGTEIQITKPAPSGRDRYCYQAPIGYVTLPRRGKRDQLFVSAEVRNPGLGMASVFIPCEALRDYFFPVPLVDDRASRPNLYDILRISQTVSPAELRVAYKLPDLELTSSGAARTEHVALERAFNILAQPELRACYNSLLADPEAPVVFPYGGFGSLLVAGGRSHDGQIFFARRILGFQPDRRQRHLHLLLRRCDFYDDSALCRDVRRKLEFWLDPAALHTVWNSTWNQWKHLAGAKIEVDATFVQSGKYRKRRGEWELVPWETALPSRLRVTLPRDFPATGRRGPTHVSSHWSVLQVPGPDSVGSRPPGYRKSGTAKDVLGSSYPR
jgi:hypothetical protein